MENEKLKLSLKSQAFDRAKFYQLRRWAAFGVMVILAVVVAVSYYLSYILLAIVITIAMLLFLVSLGIQGRIDSMMKRRVALYNKLEHWAHASQIAGRFTHVECDDDVGQAILTLQQQLKEARNSDVLYDFSMRERALLDLETGIGNREFFNSRLEALLKEEDVHGALLLMQFNDCEMISALYGTKQALSVLESLIQACKYRLSHLPSYFIARRSKFELAILIPNIFSDEAEKLIGRLYNNLMSVPLPVGVDNESFLHIGMSLFSNTQKPYQIMAEADMALRSAQLQGPSQWFMFDDGEIEETLVKGSLKWRTLLERAIQKNAFVIFFQPVIARDHDVILHHEVLSKVRNSDGNLINARVFFPMARKCGLTKAIDILVFEQVCRLLTYEPSQHEDCSINISIESLLNNDFVESLIDILIKNSTIAPRINIEISEYHLANHLAELGSTLARIAKYGVKIIADKVGQYVVNAEYLKVLPIQSIKLHRSIVLNIQDKVENQIFIQSLSSITEPRGIAMYALGVETKEEWMSLIRLGVDGGQGHYFTEPVAQVAKAIHLPE